MIQAVSNFGGSSSLSVKSICDVWWKSGAISGCYASCYVIPCQLFHPCPITVQMITVAHFAHPSQCRWSQLHILHTLHEKAKNNYKSELHCTVPSFSCF
jgi:hypothetical protein